MSDLRVDTLHRLGFIELFPNAGSWVWQVPGSHRFRVQVKLHEPLFYGHEPEWCETPEFSVYLVTYHCDSWAVSDETDPHAALELAREFIRESRRAYDMLSRIVGMAETSQLIQERQEGSQ